MARVNICGFETGDFAETTAQGATNSIQTTTVRSGTYALRCNPAASGNGFVKFSTLAADGTALGSSAVTSYTRFYFLFLTAPSSGTAAILSVLGTSSDKFAVKLDSNKNLSAWDSGTQIGSAGTTVLVSGVWYCIEVKVGSGASNVAWEIRIDGVSELSGSSTLIDSGNANSFYFGNNGNYTLLASVDLYFDDIAIDDAAYPGPGSVVRLDPAADVAKTNWLNQAGSSTNEYLSVDDLGAGAGHDTDTTYVVTSTAGTITFTVSFPALSTRQIIGTINEMKVLVWGRDTGTALTWQINLRPASNTQTTTAGDFGASYAMLGILYKTKGGTDALTIANVNTCQASIIKTQSQARELRCTCIALMLDLPGVFSRAPKILQAVNRAACY